MSRISRFVVRPIVIGPIIVLFVASGIGAFAMRGRAPVHRTVYGPVSGLVAEPETVFHAPPVVIPSPTPVAKPKPKPKPKAKAAALPAGPDLTAFRGLGTWVDLYDYAALTPESAAADMSAHGVKTLYIQTARWDKPAPSDPGNFVDPAMIERWVDAAHANGMRIVGWYLPAYDDMARDVRRTAAIASYRTARGKRFDALAIDIEYKQQMPSLSAWNAAVAEQIARVRSAVGRLYPVSAIVPAPLAMAVRPQSWTGFPWKALAASANVFQPMAYWSYRNDCPQDPSHCAYGYTRGNVEQVRALTGKPHVPVHVLGGVADSITTDDVSKFVAAAKITGSIGGSLYDYRTTQSAWWGMLAKLN